MEQLSITFNSASEPLLTETIGTRHFGTNLLFNRDVDIADATGQTVSPTYMAAMKALGAQTFRYPGGAITEKMFDLDDPFSPQQNYLQQQIDPEGQFATTLSLVGALNYAEAQSLSMTIVLPTFRFLSPNADANGNHYENVDATQVSAFVVRLLTEAHSRGVAIQAIELGNEWYVGSNAMSPIEYGRIASRLSEVTQSAIDLFKFGLSDLSGWAEPQIVVQVGHGGDLEKYTPTGTPVEDGFSGTVISATELIFRQFDRAAEKSAVDGLVTHRYMTNSDANVNGWAYIPFSKFTALATRDGGFGQLDRYVTEWNVSARNTDELGLRQAGNIIQLFAEMIEGGVDHANIWAVQQNNGSKLSTSTGLPGSTFNGLTYGGEIFRLMNANLQGLHVAPGNVVTDSASVSTFADDRKVVVYITNETALLKDFVFSVPTISYEYHHVWATTLGAASGAFASPNGKPEVSLLTGAQLSADSQTLSFALDPYEVIQIIFALGDEGVEVNGYTLNDRLDGSRYADKLLGQAGSDTISGFGGHDHLNGGVGADTLHGGDGDDTLVGGSGDDRLDGGNGRDQSSYVDSVNAVRADLQFTQTNAGDALGDVFVGVEDLGGSAFNDVLAGDGQNNVILGFAGNDVLAGRFGADTLLGGEGNDTLVGGVGADLMNGGSGRDQASYWDSLTAVCVNLQSPLVNTGDAAGDVFVDVEYLVGSAFSDNLAGDASANLVQGLSGSDLLYGLSGADTLEGGAGNDTLEGGTGSDHLDGGTGRDTASYDSATSSVRVDLLYQSTNSGDALADILTGIEDIAGSAFGDVLAGDSGANLLHGLKGNDVLAGRGGNDTLEGGDGNDTAVGGSGADCLNGGLGDDTASYWDSAEAIVVDLQASAANTGDAMGDTFLSIENLTGTAFNDGLRGDNLGNLLLGLSGNDELLGRDGDDTLDGGAGKDTLIGGLGDDILFGGLDGDVFVFTDARDTVMDFVDNVDEILMSTNLWGGNSRSLADILSPENVNVTTTGLEIMLGQGNVLDVRGIFDANLLYDDISFI